VNKTGDGPWAYLLRRLHEKNTYILLPIILGLYGINLDGMTMQLIAAIGLSISGLALVVIPENGAQRFTTLTQYISDRLREPSTWAAVPVILGSIGIHIDSVILHKLSQAGIAFGGIVAFLMADPGTLPTLLQNAANNQSTPILQLVPAPPSTTIVTTEIPPAPVQAPTVASSPSSQHGVDNAANKT